MYDCVTFKTYIANILSSTVQTILPTCLISSLFYRYRSTRGPTRAKNRLCASRAASSSANYATTSITGPCTRVPESSLVAVRSAVSCSTTADTWAHTWRSTGTGRSTSASIARRALTSEWRTTCTCAYTRARSRTVVTTAASRSPGKCCSNSTYAYTPVKSLSLAPCATSRSPTGPTWRCTCACTRASSRTRARCAPSRSPRSTTWRHTWTTTRASSRTRAISAGWTSARVATWGHTWKSAVPSRHRHHRPSRHWTPQWRHRPHSTTEGVQRDSKVTTSLAFLHKLKRFSSYTFRFSLLFTTLVTDLITTNSVAL